MCRCDYQDEKKHSKKCADKYVIKCLPCVISKPGQYCLGKDFEWSRTDVSAVSIRAENVVLDFNQRTITSQVGSQYPLVSAVNSNDLVLKNIHLEAEGDGEYSIDGIDVRDSSAVVIKSPRLINLQVGLYTESVKGLEVHGLYLENEDPESSFTNPILINLSDEIKFYDSVVENARTIFNSVLNADIQRLQSHNRGPGGSPSRCLQFSSLSVSDKTTVTNLPPSRTTESVKVSGCQLISDEEAALFAFGAPIGAFGGAIEFDFTNSHFLIENNVVKGPIGPIILQNFTSGIVKCNQVIATGDNNNSGVIIMGEGVRVENNNISSINDSPITFGLVFLGWYEIGVETNYGYNFALNNTVKGAFIGLSDGSGIVPGFDGTVCNVFRDNVATGNVTNCLFDPALGTVDQDNICGCSIDASVLRKTGDTDKNLLYLEN